MEEYKDTSTPQEQDTAATEAESTQMSVTADEVQPCDACETEAEATEAAVSEGDAPLDVAQATDSAEAEQEAQEQLLPPAPQWAFGATSDAVCSPREDAERDKKRFFIIFGSIFGVCLLILCLTFWMGSSGFKITKLIETTRTIFVRNDDGQSGLLTPQEAAELVKKSTVTVSIKTSNASIIGSGFIYSQDGYIITNHHMLTDGGEIQIILSTNEVYDATVVGSNADADVAVLKINATGLPAAAIGCSAELLAGDEVLAIGTPAKMDYAGTATFGHVSANNRLVSITDTSGTVIKKMNMIQTDTSMNNGNSGGPLADMYGRVVGIVVMKLSYYGSNSFEGIGFALPIDGVKQIADEIIKNGRFTGKNPIAEGRSLIGVTGFTCAQDYWYYVDPTSPNSVKVSAEYVEGYFTIGQNGVYVSDVTGANAVGLLRTGDVVKDVNGLKVRSIEELIAECNRYRVGTTLRIGVWRDGAYVTVEVALAEEGA